VIERARAESRFVSVLATLLDHLLFEIKPGSPEVYLLSIVSILLLSGVSMLVPALRAIRIDPLTALACE
jgi:ABC-type antimicrobial peptide transport system permease subunit